MNYGLPYMGSKNRLIEKIQKYFPKCIDNFYDLFAGGCAVTDYFLKHNTYKNYIVNDINSDIIQLYKNALNGKYKNEYNWISKEEFFKKKENDPFIKYCWSFGGMGKTYLYGDREKNKKAYHYAIVFNDWELLKDINLNYKTEKDKLENIKEIKKRRLKFSERIEHLERLERIQSLEYKNNNIEFYNQEYNNIYIKENSLLYCDIPYKNTADYLIDFDYDKFYDWCNKQKELVIISEYNMPEDKFICIYQTELMSTLKTNKKAIERLFIPKHQEKLYYRLMGNKIEQLNMFDN